MCCIDLKQQFLSYVNFNPHQSSYWNPPAFMKSCNEALSQIQMLKLKVNEFDVAVNRRRLGSTPDQETRMLHNLNQNIKICENHVKRLQVMDPDMKTSSDHFLNQYKSSLLATMQMKLLQTGLKFKQAYQKNRKPRKSSSPNLSKSPQTDPNQAPNLSRPHFIQQSQQQLLQQAAVSQYQNIQKSISKISEMYKQTATIVRMHQFMIDSIQSQVTSAEGHVQGGRKNLVDVHRRESKNRPLIIKIFVMLYLISGVYIVVLS